MMKVTPRETDEWKNADLRPHLTLDKHLEFLFPNNAVLDFQGLAELKRNGESFIAFTHWRHSLDVSDWYDIKLKKPISVHAEYLLGNGEIHTQTMPNTTHWRYVYSEVAEVDTDDVMSKQVGGDHYKKHKLQPWDIVDAFQLCFYLGNAIKYTLRIKGDTDKRIEDLEKAIHYIEKKISELKQKALQSK